jgi:ribosomal protein L10
LLLAVMEPAFRSDRSPDSVKCSIRESAKTVQAAHPYILLQAQDCRQELKAPFVYFFHLNPMKGEELHKFKIALLKNDIHLRQPNSEVLQHAVEGTRHAKLYNLLAHFGAFCYSESNKLAFLNRLLKKQSNVFLLGGIVENRIMTKEQLNEYNQMPSLDLMRAQLCHTLSSPSIALHTSINYHLTDLSGSLQRHADHQDDSSSKSS